jgi:hypothetical protein
MNKSRIILLLCFPFLLSAQEKDFQLWTKLSAAYDLSKDLSISFDQGHRQRENVALPDVTFSNISVKYDFVKRWSIASGYRFINDFDFAQNSSVNHRFYTDLNYRKKRKRWIFKNRLRYQYQEEKSTLRDKISASYNIRKTPLEPFNALELFYRNGEFKKWRYTLGLSYPLAKPLDLDAFYRIQQALNTNNPKQLYIVGIGIDYSF